MLKQHTIRHSAPITGIGLHTGETVKMTILPAAADTGLVLRRTDLDPVVQIPLNATAVTATTLSTTVGVESAHGLIEVSTVEHLMSAFWGLGIDNAIVEVNGPEVPIMDGSSNAFVFMLQSAGLKEQEAPRKFMRILKTLVTRDTKTGSWVRISPYQGTKVSFTLDYDHPVMRQYNTKVSLDLSNSCYVREVSRARTFGFVDQIEMLQASNKALGATEYNAVALGDNEIVSGSLRYQNEFARHKILDALGDLYLAGYPILGHFTGYKSGHALNNRMLRKILHRSASWELITCEDPPNKALDRRRGRGSRWQPALPSPSPA